MGGIPLMMLASMFGGGGGMGGGPMGMGGGPQGWRGGGNWRTSGGSGGGFGQPSQGPWSSNPFLSAIVSAESGGNNGAVGDGGLAKGVFQFHDATWQHYAANVPGASQYASAAQAPLEVQQQVAMSAPIREWGPETKRKLHAQFGQFDENMTIGQLSQQFGGPGSTNAAAKPGTVATGDSRAPNPSGNSSSSSAAAPAPVVQRDFSGNPLYTGTPAPVAAAAPSSADVQAAVG